MAALSYGKRMLKAGLKKNDPRKRRRLSPEEDAKFYIWSGLDKDGFQVKYIFDFKDSDSDPFDLNESSLVEDSYSNSFSSVVPLSELNTLS